ncbi:MAG: biosynthetic arginine decarboxylase [Cardiobacteriaceae bacterium]|nr:biosynthetic arginine decarboxylase [Cardiobacteriaceae bacterium]
MNQTSWQIEDAENLYKISHWSNGYFALNEKGEVTVKAQENAKAVSLIDLIDGMHIRGKTMPVLLRIQNLLEKQIQLINESFAKAITDSGYQGNYRGVFPIKVNQQAHLIEDIVRFGAPYQHGLEAGSKAELMIALSMLKEPGPLIVCNGYKDQEFVELGLGMVKLGFNVVFVIETPAELPIILESSEAMHIRPVIGVRAKLFANAAGHWTSSGGDRSMFGLNTRQLVEVVDKLKEADMLDCLQFLHYHLGSQIPNIGDIRKGVREACRYYIELVEEGAPMKYLDLGGGLAVDYDGTRTSSVHSRNYSLQEYCVDVVETIQLVLDEKQIPHPTIVTESGRATVAYSSVLLFDILDVAGFADTKLPERREDEHPLISNLYYAYETLNYKNAQEVFNDALYYRDEARNSFIRGNLPLRVRSEVEQIFMVIMKAIAVIINDYPDALSEPEVLKTMLADIYYGNFSVFQSLPDAWAIDQIFPLMPIHRLTERPNRATIIADLTCDSDGKIDKFVQNGELVRTIPLHAIREDEPYYLGVFLVGAYQETLGDLHNLLGDTHVVSVYIHQDGNFDFVNEIEGDSVSDVLSYVEYQPHTLLSNFRETAEKAVRSGRITPAERQKLVSRFEAGLRGYTYYEQ